MVIIKLDIKQCREGPGPPGGLHCNAMANRITRFSPEHLNKNYCTVWRTAVGGGGEGVNTPSPGHLKLKYFKMFTLKIPLS